MKFLTALIPLCILLVCPSVPAALDAPPPCSDPAYRQFDFWIGHWEVYNPEGQRVGQNRITVEQNGCVLREHWVGAGGGTGESFNIYDRSRDVWHQTWVSAQGVLLLLEGGLNEQGQMTLSGTTKRPDGTVMNRITWTPLSADQVRQHWETSTDAGKTWQTAFDGLYQRVSETGEED